jgi:2-methylcitrate dehydratase PrpD
MVLNACRNVPEKVVSTAVRHIVDSVGVALAGATNPLAKAVCDNLDGPNSHEYGASVLGRRVRLSSRSAAIANAMASHLHDYDDDDALVACGHPTAVVFNAALAVAEEHDCDAQSLIVAYVSGVETIMRIGMVANPSHFINGWHATTTLGVFGAAVACSLLMQATPEELESAIGISASLASGLSANFGSDMKPIQVGHAAGNGVWAAKLATSGVRPSKGALFGPKGLIALTSTRDHIDAAVEGFGCPFGLESPGLHIKVYPSCSSNHSAVDALLAIRSDEGLTASDIDAIDAWIGPDAAAVLAYDAPETAFQAKFSLRYNLATAIAFGGVWLEHFTEEAIRSEEVRRLMRLIIVHTDHTMVARTKTGVAHGARVSVRTKSGRSITRSVRTPRGSGDNPISDDDLRKKFIACATRSLSVDAADRVYSRLMSIQTSPSVRNIVNATGRGAVA